MPPKLWAWPNFSLRDEIASNGNGAVIVDPETLDMAESMRAIYARKMGKIMPLNVTSGYRDPAYNQKIGGGKNSMHLEGKALDISTNGHDRRALYAAAKEAGFTGFGFYNTFIHVDTGRPRFWEGSKGVKSWFV